MKRVLLLNGPSSAGKTTLSLALRTALAEKGEDWGLVCIDDYLRIVPGKRVYEEDVYAIAQDMNRAALPLLKEKTGVIIDHVITSKRVFEALKEALSAYTLITVKVTCPLEVLRARELARGDRRPGTAEDSMKCLYPSVYDLVLDTAQASVEDNTQRLLALL